MRMLSATNSGHIRTVRTPGAFWSVDLDIYIYIFYNFNES